MRRKKIGTHDQANVFFDEEYLPDHNRRFAKPPAAAEDYHRKSPAAAELRTIFRLETERTISNDWVVRYQNRLLQVERQNRNWAPARAKVMVCEWQDGSIDIHYRERKLSWTEIEAQAVKPAVKAPIKVATHRKPEPATDHPRRKSYQTMRAPGPVKEPEVVRLAASASP